MKKIILSAVTATTLILSACNSTEKIAIPLSNSIPFDDTYTIIWNGVSRAYRFTNSQWVRAENYDYQFDVVQKRYDNQWKSIKSLHRIHPGYDGKAGSRNQTMYFDVAYKSLADGKVNSVIHSSLGAGTGTSDTAFRETALMMYADHANRFMPYNKYRITQHYNYEAGLLRETVELIKEKDGKEIPFMKNEEIAFIFIKNKLDKAPTTFKQQ
jgi:hypothetical protein